MMKKIIWVFTLLICFTMCGDVVHAITYNGSGGGTSSDNGGSTGCPLQKPAYICGNSGQKIAVKITLIYYDSSNKKRQKIGESVYVARKKGNGDGWCPRKKGEICINDDYQQWFKVDKKGNPGFNSESMKKDIIGEKTATVDEAKTILQRRWLSKMGKYNGKKIKIDDLNKPSCSVDAINTGNCEGESGYRILIEPVIHGIYNNKNYYTSIKQFAKTVSNFDKALKSDSDWVKFGQGMWTTFGDVDVYAEKPGAGAKATFKCLKNLQCGYGYNIIDIGKTLNQNQYTCDYESGTKCKVVDSSGKKVGSVNCNDFANGGNYKIDEINHYITCPTIKITYGCAENTEKYGRCNITRTVNGKTEQIDEVDCNKYTNKAPTYKIGGQNVIFTDKACPYKPKFNYDADVACENCDKTGTNGSYHIQDVADWEAILHSEKRTDNDTLRGYYKKADGVFCRDEFNVVFPNSNTVSSMRIEAGRYLTVNKNGGVYNNGVYNFEPIKVTRTTECISADSNKLNNYPSDSKMGEIDLKYYEKKGNKYNGTFTLNPDSTKTTTNISNPSKVDVIHRVDGAVENVQYYVKAKQTAAYFKPNDNLYRYVSANGTSVMEAPTEHLNNFIDLKTSSLPISFENDEGVTIGLKYKLPDDTGLIQAFSKPNNITVKYLSTDNTVENIYEDENRLEKLSACYKLYPDLNSEKYQKCKESRRNKDVVEDANKCLKQFGNINTETFAYSCDLNSCKDGKCPNEKKCRIENGKYYNDAGNTITKEEFERDCACTDLGNGKYIGKFQEGRMPDELNDYTEYDKQCCVFDNALDEQMVEKECPNNEKMGLSPCYRCPDTGLCPMPGNICPGKGKAIYRTIDLNNPFPGQNGKIRQAGNNWCQHNTTNNTYICDGKPSNKNSSNQLVYSQIIKNRGVKGYEVYSKEPLYEVELDAKSIRDIRDENNKQPYDSWDGITYTATGSKSKFINETLDGLGIEVKGKCVESQSDKRTCVEE